MKPHRMVTSLSWIASKRSSKYEVSRSHPPNWKVSSSDTKLSQTWVSSVFPIRIRKRFQQPLWYYQPSLQTRLNVIPKRERKSKRTSLRSVIVTPLWRVDAQLGAPIVRVCREDPVQMARWRGPFYRCGTQKSEWENPREWLFSFVVNLYFNLIPGIQRRVLREVVKEKGLVGPGKTWKDKGSKL